jgi:hypothetical protein
MQTYKAFREPTPYEVEKQRAERQRRYAELLQQQAMAPEEEPYTFQGFRAMPSPANALSRVLQAYAAKKVGEKAEQAEARAREADIAGAEALRRELAPQARIAAPANAEIAASVGMPQVGEEGEVSYTPTVQAPMRTEMVGPTAAERRNIFANYAVTGTPTAQRLAQVLAGQEPQTQVMEVGDQLLNVSDGTATPVMMNGKPVTAAPKPAPGSSLQKLYNERSQFPPGDPRIPIWDQAIKSEIGSKSPVVNLPPTTRDKQKDEDSLRSDLESRLNKMDWAGTQSVMQRILTAPETAVGDVELVYAVAKASDSSGAVRSEDFDLRAREGSLGGRIQALYKEATSGRPMSPKRRQELIDSARQFYEARKTSVNQLLSTYEKMANKRGLDVEMVVGPFRPQPLWSEDDEKELQRLRNKAEGRQ